MVSKAATVYRNIDIMAIIYLNLTIALPFSWPSPLVEVLHQASRFSVSVVCNAVLN